MVDVKKPEAVENKEEEDHEQSDDSAEADLNESQVEGQETGRLNINEGVKTAKKVGFVVDEEKEILEQFLKKRKKKVISSEESQELQQKLANEFVKAKMKKMAWYVRFYNWLNKTFTE